MSRSHARSLLAQLREIERDEKLPEDLRESSAERADQLESDLEERGSDG